MKKKHKSVVDMMIPYQRLYSVIMNKIGGLIEYEKEKTRILSDKYNNNKPKSN